MSIRSILILLTILLVLLPVGVAATAWWGLERMDAEIEDMSEEYAEVRTLSEAESHLELAIEAMREGSDGAREAARKHLGDTERVLLTFIGAQASSSASAEHQREEFGEVEEALAGLRALLERHAAGAPSASNASDAARAPGQGDDLASTIRIRASIRSLRGIADEAIAAAQSHAREIERSTLRLVGVTGAVAVVACVAVAIWANRSVMRSLRTLHRSVAARTDGARPARRADVGTVVSEIDQFNERIYRELQEKNRELLRRERVAGIGLLAADVAHELRNPLNAMLGLTELSLQATAQGSLDEPRRAEVHESLSVVRREAVRCREIVERLMGMVRARSLPTKFDAAALLAETIQVARAARPDKAACFQLLRAGQPLAVFASAQEVRQIVLTLLINAADAVTEGGRIEVDATASDAEVWLRVRDDGKGFEPSRRLDRAVPFDTTRAAEGGTGLGLSIAQSLAADIGAEIRCHSEGPGKGSLFLLAIPLREDAR